MKNFKRIFLVKDKGTWLVLTLDTLFGLLTLITIVMNQMILFFRYHLMNKIEIW